MPEIVDVSLDEVPTGSIVGNVEKVSVRGSKIVVKKYEIPDDTCPIINEAQSKLEEVRAANSQLRSACAAYYRDNKELAQLLEMHEDFTLNDSDTLESELLFNVIQAALSANVMYKIKAFLDKDMAKRLECFTEQWENKRKQFAKD